MTSVFTLANRIKDAQYDSIRVAGEILGIPYEPVLEKPMEPYGQIGSAQFFLKLAARRAEKIRGLLAQITDQI